MKINFKILFMCLIAILEQGIAQEGQNKLQTFITLSTGYNNTFGIFGFSIGGQHVRKMQFLEFNTGIGIDIYHSLKLGGGVTALLVKDRKIIPLICANYCFAPFDKIYLGSNDSNIYNISSDSYLNSLIGIQVRSDNRQKNFSIKLGYSYLLNDQEIIIVNGIFKQDDFDLIRKNIDGGLIIAFEWTSYFK